MNNTVYIQINCKLNLQILIYSFLKIFYFYFKNILTRAMPESPGSYIVLMVKEVKLTFTVLTDKYNQDPQL